MNDAVHVPWWAADDADRRLKNTIAALNESAEMISTACADTVSVGEVELALVDVLHLNQIADILDREIDTQSITSLLAAYDFARLRPERLCEVEFVDSIIPDGVSILLTEVKVKLKGEIWMVHKNDADPFPSNPHAHNYQRGLKMHLGNGDLYGYRAKVASTRLRKPVLLDFRSRVEQANSTIVLPPLAV
jgi:hypothetical protein